MYCILAAGVAYATTSTDLIFLLDDVESSRFTWALDSTVEEYQYNQLVYSNHAVGSAAGLPSGLHNLTALSFDAVLFDYAIYT